MKYISYADQFDFWTKLNHLLEEGGKVIACGTTLLDAEYTYTADKLKQIHYTNLFWAVVENAVPRENE